eukprot:g6332.t1
MQNEHHFGYHTEETDLDGNLMSWLWRDDGGVLPVPESADFAPLTSAMHNEHCYYEGYGVAPLNVQRTMQPTGVAPLLDKELLSPMTATGGGFSPVDESPTYARPLGRSSKVLTTAQAKNRKAQKKFREKQKAKMHNLEEEVEMLRNRVQNLSLHNKELENSNALLQKVVKMRDNQMNTLKHRNEWLLTQHESRGKSKKAITNGTHRNPVGDELAFANFPTQKDIESGRGDENMKQIWKNCVDRFSALLIDNDLHPNDSSILDKLHRVVLELGACCMKYASIYPLRMCPLLSNPHLSPQFHHGKEEAMKFWRTVLRSLNLTIQQEQQILSLRNRFFQQLDCVWKERTHLNEQIKVAVEARDSVLKSNSMSCKLGKDIREAIEGFQLTISTDVQHHNDFIASIFQFVMEDVQIARVFVQSYPNYPDLLILANLVYEKHQRMSSQNKSASFDAHAAGPLSLTSS